MTVWIDPVCGMAVEPGSAPAVRYRGVVYRFCSEMCRQAFSERPGRYLKGGDALHESGEQHAVEVLDE